MKHNNILLILISVVITIIIGIVIFLVVKKHNKTNDNEIETDNEIEIDTEDEIEDEWDCTSDGRCIQTKDGRYSSADVCRANCNVSNYYPQSLLYYPRRPYRWRLPPMYRPRRHRRRKFSK